MVGQTRPGRLGEHLAPSAGAEAVQAAADPDVFVKETSRSRKAVVFSKLICPSCLKAKEVRLRDVVCPAPGAHTGHSSGAAAAAAGCHNHNKKMPAHLPPLATDACAAACPCHPQIMSKHLPSEQYTIIELDTRPDCDQLQDALERLTVSGEGLCGLGARGWGVALCVGCSQLQAGIRGRAAADATLLLLLMPTPWCLEAPPAAGRPHS